MTVEMTNLQTNTLCNVKHVFIIGSKGIPAKYGGFETFVEKLTYYEKNKMIRYHVSCLASNTVEYEYNGARCFNVKVPNIGAAKAVFYDLMALRESIKYIKRNKIIEPIIYILACRIGPFIGHYRKIIESLGGSIYINPDGHEWKRDKWNWIIKQYWKLSEKLMVKHANIIICDSKSIRQYIQDMYKKFHPNTIFIAYGAEVNKSTLCNDDNKVLNWYKAKNVKPNEYYLVVGRFVPENNYEIMIKEFMKSKTKKDFVLITNVENNKFYEVLKTKTRFDKDKRIKFVGTVYDSQLLKKIRENAYGYLHGHEVGGTNPSLLEALSSTNINLLLDVCFNKEVGEDGAIYWNKNSGNLAELINKVDKYNTETIYELGLRAKMRIKMEYSWDKIICEYERVFTTKMAK